MESPIIEEGDEGGPVLIKEAQEFPSRSLAKEQIKKTG